MTIQLSKTMKRLMLIFIVVLSLPLLLLLLVLFVPYVRLHLVGPPPPKHYDHTVTTTVGYQNWGGQGKFTIPGKYSPEVGVDFFRIVVSYPDMTPLPPKNRGALTPNAVEIVVEGYPKIRTRPEGLVQGVIPAQFVESSKNFDVYRESLGKAPPMTAYVFRDTSDNLAMMEILGTWSWRDSIYHGIRPGYIIKSYFPKKYEPDFMTIDTKVVQLVESMHDKQ